MNKNRIQDLGLKIEELGLRTQARGGLRHLAGLTQSPIPNPQSSKGFSLVSAIFLLVVIAALGVFAVTLSTTQHQSDAMDVMGKRAYQSARAGIEWGAYKIIQESAVAGGFALACQAAGSSVALALPAPELSRFNVNVACSSVSFYDGVSGVAYSLSSTATTGGVPGDSDYIERKISVTIAQ